MKRKYTIAIIGKDHSLSRCIASNLNELIPTREPLVADDVASFCILSAEYKYFDFVFIDSIGFNINTNREWLLSMFHQSPQTQIIMLEDKPNQLMEFIRAGGSGCLDRLSLH
ncbi:MAG: hypothetical protein IPO07_27515 [Haliscomenobacter sp.]|nr:hypothetical protein [Haliscomenobacter sp.]MBK9492129.1 hypothetical protein [Haliscomenobacter sp.]